MAEFGIFADHHHLALSFIVHWAYGYMTGAKILSDIIIIDYC